MIPGGLYVIGGLGIAAIAAGGYGMLEHAWRQNAELRLVDEQAANKQNQETIKTLTKATEIGSQVALELSNQLAAITAKQEEEDAAVTELANSDEAVKKFLDTAVPDKLRCLWEHKLCKSGNSNPSP